MIETQPLSEAEERRLEIIKQGDGNDHNHGDLAKYRLSPTTIQHRFSNSWLNDEEMNLAAGLAQMAANSMDKRILFLSSYCKEKIFCPDNPPMTLPKFRQRLVRFPWFPIPGCLGSDKARNQLLHGRPNIPAADDLRSWFDLDWVTLLWNITGQHWLFIVFNLTMEKNVVYCSGWMWDGIKSDHLKKDICVMVELTVHHYVRVYSERNPDFHPSSILFRWNCRVPTGAFIATQVNGKSCGVVASLFGLKMSVMDWEVIQGDWIPQSEETLSAMHERFRDRLLLINDRLHEIVPDRCASSWVSSFIREERDGSVAEEQSHE